MADKPFDPYAFAGAGVSGTPDAPKPGDAIKTAKLQDARGLGSLSKTTFTPPKMNSGEEPSAYSARVRKAREDFDAAQLEGQKKAVRGLK